MPLNNPEKRGLKSYTLTNQTKDVVKVGTLSIPAGDEVTVSEEVARQMLGADPGLKLKSGGVIEEHPENEDQVKEVDSASADAHPDRAKAEEAGGGSARSRSGRRGR